MISKKQKHKKEQGIALMLVLGVMSILIGIALTFASSMRLTEKTSKNYYYSWQALYTARAGMHRAIDLLKRDVKTPGGDLHSDNATFDDINGADTNCDNLNEEWFTHFNGAGSDPFLDENNDCQSKWLQFTEPSYVNLGPNIYTRYAVLVRDEAGKINVNVARNYTAKQGMSTFELSLNKAFATENITPAAVDNIIDYLYGTDLQPGNAGKDDNNNNHQFGGALDDGRDDDPTLPIDDEAEGVDEPYEYCPYDPLQTDDRIFHSLEEVADISKSGIPFADFQAIQDYLTVYSKDEEQALSYNDTTAKFEWINKIAINYVENAGNIYNILAPGAEGPEDIEKALAIIDYIDEDAIPSVYTMGNGTKLYGMEGITISEIMPQPELRIKAIDLFDTAGKRGAWQNDNNSNFIKGTNSAVTGSAPETPVPILRPGRYVFYAETFSNTAPNSNSKFNIYLKADSTSINSTVGNYTGTEWQWTEIGPIDIEDPANCIIKLTAGGSDPSYLRAISLSQQGPPGNETHDSEFIELFNKSRRDVYVGGWEIRITPNNTTADNNTRKYTIPTFTQANGDYFTYPNTVKITMDKLPIWYRPVVPSGGRLILTRDVITTATNIFTNANDSYIDALPFFLPPADNNGDTINFESSFGNRNDTWGDDPSEQYPVLSLSNGSQNFCFDTTGSNDLKDYLVELYAPKYNTPENNDPFIDSCYFEMPKGDNRSNERILPFDYYKKIYPTLPNQSMFNKDNSGSSAGNYYQDYTFMFDNLFTNNTSSNNIYYESLTKNNTTPWLIKDGNLATLPELMDIPYKYNSSSNNTLHFTVDDLKLFADQTTTSFIKLEAEDYSTTLPGISPKMGPYGTTWHPLPPSVYANYEWISGFKRLIPSATASASYIEPGSYNLFAFGKPSVPFETTYAFSAKIYPLPRGGQFVAKVNTIMSDYFGPNRTYISLGIGTPENTGGSYFDYAILTPGNPMAGRININTVIDPRVIMALPGIDTLPLAETLFDNRPYYSQADLIQQITEPTGRLYNTAANITLDHYNKFANLITFRSDIFEIICKGEVYVDKDGDGTPEKILATQTVKAVIDRSDYAKNKNTGAIKTLYYRVDQN